MIEFESVEHTFRGGEGGGSKALDGLTLRVEQGETLCLIGASGCGKTSALRAVNRLLEPEVGRVLVAGKDVGEQDPIRLRRGIGYVLQHGGLLPHLDIARNVSLLGELEGWDLARRRARAGALLDAVRLEPGRYLDRYPHELSGGQRQRVGVARALFLDPPIVLLDEPFGALDPLTRAELQAEFRGLAQGGRTFLMVTHDLREAFALGDRIALMDAGRIVQLGTQAEFTETPADERVARWMESLR